MRFKPIGAALLMIALAFYVNANADEVSPIKWVGYWAFSVAVTLWGWYVAREDLAWAQEHGLKIQEGGLLITNGGAKTLLSFDHIKEIKCTLFRNRVVGLKIVSDSHTVKSLMHYENNAALAEHLLGSAPQDKIRLKKWFTPNKSIDRTRGD